MIRSSWPGQGTVALEMLADAPDLDQIVVPIGGGGLISGIAVAAKALKPAVAMIGVEAALFPSFHNALHGDDLPDRRADAGGRHRRQDRRALTPPIVEDLVAEIVLVEEGFIERAVAAYATLQRTMAEGAGAAGLAAMLARARSLCGPAGRPGAVRRQHRCAAPRLRHGARTGAGGPHRLVPHHHERPAGLARSVASRLGELGANILEVSHGRLFLDVPAKGVTMDVTIETRDAQHTAEVLEALARDGLDPQRLGPRGLSENAY